MIYWLKHTQIQKEIDFFFQFYSENEKRSEKLKLLFLNLYSMFELGKFEYSSVPNENKKSTSMVHAVSILEFK